MMLDAVGTWMTSAYLLSAVPLGLAWALTAVLARGRASVRHHVWVVALTVAIVAPAARGVVPRLNVPLLPDGAVSPLRSTGVTAAEAARPETVGEEHTQSSSRWSARMTAALVWIVGAVPLLCLRALRRTRLSRLVAEASAVDGWADVRSHARVSVPILAGFVRPTILLPIAAAQWPIDAREAVLAHERAHVQRHDHVIALVSEIATIVYWLNPLAWIAAVALEREREAACDEEVLRAGIKPSVYAAALLRVAQTLPARSAPAVPCIAGGQLDARIRAVLHRAPNSGRVPLSWLATMPLIAVCAVSLASVRLVARTPHQTMFGKRPTPARDIALKRPAELPMISLARQPSSTVAGRTGTDPGSLLDSGALGSTLDIDDFCCPDYLLTMIQRIRSRWVRQAEAPGTVVVRFTIERDGTISRSMVEKPSGYRTLNTRALTAVRLARKLPPLPTAFPNATLTVHLNFEYQ